ncbi:hypothetical protein ABPG74_002293 [Tetrahymena malaccensis]
MSQQSQMDDGKQLEIIEQLIKMKGAKDLNSQNNFGSVLNSIGYPQSSNSLPRDQNYKGYQYDEVKDIQNFDEKKKFEIVNSAQKNEGIDRIQNSNSNTISQETQQNLSIPNQNIQDQNNMQMNQQNAQQQQQYPASYYFQGQKAYQQPQTYPTQQQQQQQFYNNPMQQQQQQYNQQYQYPNYSNQYPQNYQNNQQYYQQPPVYNYHQTYPSSQIPQQTYQQQNPVAFQNPSNYHPYYQYQNQQTQAPYYQIQSQQNVYQQQNIVGINQNSNYQSQYAVPQISNPSNQVYDQNSYMQKQTQNNQQMQQKQFGYNNNNNSIVSQNQNLPNNAFQNREGIPVYQNSAQNSQIINNNQIKNSTESYEDNKSNIAQRSLSQQNNQQTISFNQNQNLQNNSSQKGYSKHLRNKDDNFDQNSSQKFQKHRRHNSREREISNEKLTSKNDISSYQSIKSRRENKSKYGNKARGSSRYSSKTSSSSRSRNRSPSSSRSRSSSLKPGRSRYSRKKNESRSNSSEQSGSSFHSKSSRNNNSRQNKQNKSKIVKSSSLNDINQSNKKSSFQIKSNEKTPQIKRKIFLQNGTPISTVYNTERNEEIDNQKKPEIQITKRSIKSINLSGSKLNNEQKKIKIIKGLKDDFLYQESQDDEIKNDQIPIIEFNFKKEAPKLCLEKLNIFKMDQDEINEEVDDNVPKKIYQQQRGIKPQLSRQQLDQIKDSPQKQQEQQQQTNKISFSIDYNQLNNQEQVNPSSNQSDSSKKKLLNSQMYSYNILGKEKRGYSQIINLKNKITKIIEDIEELQNEQQQQEQQQQQQQMNIVNNQSDLNQDDFTKDDIIGGGMNQNRYFCDKKGQICFKCGKPGHVRNACVMNEEKDVCTYCLGDHFMAKCTQKVCFKCGEIGHERNQCPVMNVDGNNNFNSYQKKRIPKCNNCTKMGHIQSECGIIRPNYDAKQELSFSYMYNEYDFQNIICISCQQPGHISCFKNIQIYDCVYSEEKLSNKIRQQLFKTIYMNKFAQNKNNSNDIEQEEEEAQNQFPSQIDIEKEEKIQDVSIQKSISESEAEEKIEEQEKQRDFLEFQNNQQYEDERQSFIKQQIYDQSSEEVIIKSPPSQGYTFSEKDVSQEEQFTDSVLQHNANFEGTVSDKNEQSFTTNSQNA